MAEAALEPLHALLRLAHGRQLRFGRRDCNPGVLEFSDYLVHRLALLLDLYIQFLYPGRYGLPLLRQSIDRGPQTRSLVHNLIPPVLERLLLLIELGDLLLEILEVVVSLGNRLLEL